MSWPPPVHTSRMPWPEGFKEPSAPAKLRDMAERHGWKAELTYAQGYVPGVKKDSTVLVHSVAVRFRGITVEKVIRGGFVVYEAKAEGLKLAWTARTTMVWGGDHWPVFLGLGVEDVKTYLVESWKWEGRAVAVWSQALRTKAALAKARQKAAAKERPKKAREHA